MENLKELVSDVHSDRNDSIDTKTDKWAVTVSQMVRHKGIPSFWTGSDLTVQRAMTLTASQESILSHYLMLDELDTHLTTSCYVKLVHVANKPPGVMRSCMKTQLESKVASNAEKEISPALEVPMAALKTEELKLVITDLQNRRWGATSTPTRSEVRGGERKPYI